MSATSLPPHAPGLPAWLPDGARAYLDHTVRGRPLRAVAADHGCSASTVLRRVRAIEDRRDDPAVDELLGRLEGEVARTKSEGSYIMSAMPQRAETIDDETLAREGRRILRRLDEPDAVLVTGPGMPKAVVLRGLDGTPTRTATLPRAVAQAFVMKDWLACCGAGKVTRYRLSDAGRAALRRMLGDKLKRRAEARGMAEAPSPFLTQQMDMAEGTGPDGEAFHVNLAESPLGALARRRDRDGKPFLSAALVAAGERLRADFERAQIGPRVGQDWERFLAAGSRGDLGPSDPVSGPSDARARVDAALRALGPGLGDVVLRVCCFLEGIEAAEKRMGWAARSGKVVLRIALQRLQQHYAGL